MRCRTYCLALLSALTLATPVLAQAAASPPPSSTAPAQTPAPAAETPISLLVLDLEPIAVDVEKMKIINGAVVDVLSGYEQLEIVSQGDIQQMVDFEAKKQALGCDTSSCLAEIAGAMGASYVVFGRVGRLDDVLFVQLNLFDSGKGRAVAREEIRATKLSELPDLIRPALGRLVAPLTGVTPPPPVVPTSAPDDDDTGVLASPLLWSGAALSAVGLIGSAGLMAGVLWAEGTLGQVDAPLSDKNTAADLGPWMFVGALGGAAVAAGGIALVGAAFLME